MIQPVKLEKFWLRTLQFSLEFIECDSPSRRPSENKTAKNIKHMPAEIKWNR